MMFDGKFLYDRIKPYDSFNPHAVFLTCAVIVFFV